MAKKVVKLPKPTIEILYACSLCGERIKECEFVDEMEAVCEISRNNPDSITETIDTPDIEGLFGPITFFVIYRKLNKRIVDPKDLRAAIKKHIEE
jgi:hypothetical protein